MQCAFGPGADLSAFGKVPLQALQGWGATNICCLMSSVSDSSGLWYLAERQLLQAFSKYDFA